MSDSKEHKKEAEAPSQQANLGAGAVTINNTFVTGQVLNAGIPVKQIVSVDATCVLTGQGGGTNLIPAALFGLTQILSVDAVRSSTVIYPAAPDLAGAGVLIGAVGTGVPTDLTATVRIVVTGFPATTQTYTG